MHRSQQNVAIDGLDGSVQDCNLDALHILPLAFIPLETRAIRRALLIKNARLDSVVELFDDVQTGSGQIEIEDLVKEFGWPTSPPHPDLKLLRRLGQLSSYDVFSLRITLRERGIPVNAIDGLRLSPGKVNELTAYMTQFTRPLIRQIYGADDLSMQSFDDIVRLFNSPDERTALTKLQQMADRLKIRLYEIPRFLENYGDIFLSISYYRQCVDQILPCVECFLRALKRISENNTLSSDAALLRTCKLMEAKITQLIASISGCLENFERSTNDLWQNLSAERFRKVEQLVRSYHTSMGGALCSLSVKVGAWTRRFPDESRNLGRQAKFVMSEMKLGFEKIEQLDFEPMLAALH